MRRTAEHERFLRHLGARLPRPYYFFLLVWVLSCRPPAPPEKLVGRGVVQKVIPADRRGGIAPDDIPGFMRAVTLSFEVRNPAPFGKFNPAERVRLPL